MKTIFCLAIMVMAAFSTAYSQVVSESEAQIVAVNFFRQVSGQPHAQLFLAQSTTSNGQNAQGSQIATVYVFEPKKGPGFVLVSADKNAPPILAYSDKNRFDIDHPAPQAQYFLDAYATQIKDIRKARYKATEKVQNDWKALREGSFAQTESNGSAGPLLTTTWGQGFPYNNLCPLDNVTMSDTAKTGCVATAMAQIIRYWQYPNGDSYHYAKDVDNIKVEIKNGVDQDRVWGKFEAWIGGGYNWLNMPNQMVAGDPNDIARLMYHAGVSIGMNYGILRSGAPTDEVAEVMNEHFGYEEGDHIERDDVFDVVWHQMLQESLDKGIPVIYRCIGIHTWVCDGYSTFFGDHFYSMNWGWRGNSNGFYDLNALWAEGNDFNNDQAAIFGIVPPCPLSYFSNGIAFGSVEAARWITATSTIAPMPGLVVTFDAGESVTLLPGFEANLGCNFTALIEGCGGYYFSGEDAGDRSLEEQPAHSEANALMANEINIAPNPFSGSTTVTYTLQSEQQVAMNLMDATGRLVATPLPAQTQPEGEHQFNFEAGNLPAGMYFLVLQLGEKRETKRLILTN